MSRNSVSWFRAGLALVLLVILGGLILVGCVSEERREADGGTRSLEKTGSSAPDSIKKPVWYNFVIQGRHEGGWLTVTLNGFPVKESTGMIRYRKSEVDLNTALIGEGNQLTLRSEPLLLRDGEGIEVGDPGISGWVRRGKKKISGAKISSSEIDSSYQLWKKRVQKQWKRYREREKQWLEENPEAKEQITWKKGGALDSIRSWVERNPLTVTTTFDNEAGPDFSRIFEEAPVLEDTPATRERLRDYAIHLRDLLQAGGAEAIYEEFRPSVSKDLGWFKITRSGRRDSAIVHIRTDWTERWETDFTRSEVELRRWSGGRVWELLVREEDGGLRPFFEGDAATSLDVYVAEIGGELKVVR